MKNGGKGIKKDRQVGIRKDGGNEGRKGQRKNIP